MSKTYFIFIFAIICIATACNKRPEYVLSDSEMESLLTDLILADAYEQSAASRTLSDSVRMTFTDAIMAQHGVDQQTLDSTFAWYSRNLDDYYRLYTRVDKRIAKMNKKVGGNVNDNKDLNDIWQMPVRIQLSPLAYSDALVFEMPGESVGKGEKLEWYFRLSNDVRADATLGVDYTNGATAISRRELSGSRNVSLSLIVDTLLTPRRVFGLLRVNRRDMPLWLDSIRLTKTPFDSTAYDAFRNSRFMMPPKRRVNVLLSTPSEVQTATTSVSTSVQGSSTPPMPQAPPPPPPPPAKKSKMPDASRPGL